MKRPVAAVDGVLVHLPPPGQRRGAAPERDEAGAWPVAGAGAWLVAVGGLVAAIGLLLWARVGPLTGVGYGVGGMALFGLGGVATVAGLALIMAGRADRDDHGDHGDHGSHAADPAADRPGWIDRAAG